MRWEHLFADLESRFETAERADLDAEIDERTRDERAQVDLTARLLAHVGAPVRIVRRDGATLTGHVADGAGSWLLVDTPSGQLLVPLAAVAAIEGLGSAAAPVSHVRRRLGMGSVLRELADARIEVVVEATGARWRGTVTAVGADHLDLATSDGASVAVPLDAILTVRTA